MSEKLFDLCQRKKEGKGKREERGPGSRPKWRPPQRVLFLLITIINKGEQASLLSWLKAIVLCRACSSRCCSWLPAAVDGEDSLSAASSRPPPVPPGQLGEMSSQT